MGVEFQGGLGYVHFMTEADRAILRRFKAALAQRSIFARVVLFGSRARGDAGPLSDMDVIVIPPQPIDDDLRDAIYECAWEADFGQSVVLSVIPLSSAEWESPMFRSSMLGRAVDRDGMTV